VTGRPGTSRIVVACYEVPSWGGAATSAYALFELMRERSVPAGFLTLVPAGQADLLSDWEAGSAGGTGSDSSTAVRSILLPEDREKWDATVAAQVDLVSPALFLAVGWPAAGVLGRALPEIPLVLLTSGLDQAKGLVTEGAAADLVSAMEAMPELAGLAQARPGEREAVDLADYVICHSEAIRCLFPTFFPEAGHKLHPRVVSFAEWICRESRRHAPLRRPFSSRAIDVLFVANSWTRPEKNYPLVRRIAAALPEASVHIVGDVPEPVPGAHHHGFLADRERVMGLMGDARVVACPSTFDSAPGVLFEAAVLGANIVASGNCGNWSVCHPDLVARPPSAESFVAAVQAAIARPYPSRLETYLDGQSFADLMDALDRVRRQAGRGFDADIGAIVDLGVAS